MTYAITDFSATPYDKGVLLSWTAGYGQSGSTSQNMCKVTIQYSVDGYPHIIPNTPPYVVRDLKQSQGTVNVLYHPNLDNDTEYFYSLFVYYYDTDFWHGTYISKATPTSGSGAPFTDASVSFTKLGTNTRISPLNNAVANIVVWLPESESSRQKDIEAAIRTIKPAHVKVNILYENYYIAQTTTEQFASGSIDTNVYKIEKGTIINKVATIDSSYSGDADIKGGS